MNAATPPTASATAKLLSNIFKTNPINKLTSSWGTTTKMFSTPVRQRKKLTQFRRGRESREKRASRENRGESEREGEREERERKRGRAMSPTLTHVHSTLVFWHCQRNQSEWEYHYDGPWNSRDTYESNCTCKRRNINKTNVLHM